MPYFVGAINVTYRAEQGNVNALSEGASLATPGMDFSDQGGSVLLGDDEQSAVIGISITNVRLPHAPTKLVHSVITIAGC